MNNYVEGNGSRNGVVRTVTNLRVGQRRKLASIYDRGKIRSLTRNV